MRPIPSSSTAARKHLSTRRPALFIAALATVALGLSIRALSDAAWSNPAGDALYAVLVYIAVAILIPRKPKILIACAAVVACVMVELLQLSGLPAELGHYWPPIRLLLGTTFGLLDVMAYAVGVAAAYAADRAAGTLRQSFGGPAER